MTSLEELKQELINQKNEIEAKGGTVIVANTYPSPAEITAGIKTITASTNSGDTTVTITSANTQNLATSLSYENVNANNECASTISSVDSTLNTLSNVVPNTETPIKENEVDSTIKELDTNNVASVDNSIEATNSNQVDESDLSANNEVLSNETINNIIPESGTTATIEPNNETIYSSNIVN